MDTFVVDTITVSSRPMTWVDRARFALHAAQNGHRKLAQQYMRIASKTKKAAPAALATELCYDESGIPWGAA